MERKSVSKRLKLARVYDLNFRHGKCVDCYFQMITYMEHLSDDLYALKETPVYDLSAKEKRLLYKVNQDYASVSEALKTLKTAFNTLAKSVSHLADRSYTGFSFRAYRSSLRCSM